MIKTFGLTRIALPVKDVKRSSFFYQKVFGAREMYSNAGLIQVQTPGSKYIIVFEKQKSFSSRSKHGFHFGFRSPGPFKVESVIKTAEQAGER